MDFSLSVFTRVSVDHKKLSPGLQVTAVLSNQGSSHPDSYRFPEHRGANNLFHTNHSQSVATLVIESA